MPKFTPGEWLIEQGTGFDDDKLFIMTEQRIQGSLIPIAEIDFDYHDPIGSEQRANATLIAAAPDLYAVLSELVEALDGRVHSTPLLRAIAKGRAALSRADGDAP